MVLGPKTTSVAADGDIVVRLRIVDVYFHAVRTLVEVAKHRTTRRIPHLCESRLVGVLDSALMHRIGVRLARSPLISSYLHYLCQGQALLSYRCPRYQIN